MAVLVSLFYLLTCSLLAPVTAGPTVGALAKSTWQSTSFWRIKVIFSEEI